MIRWEGGERGRRGQVPKTEAGAGLRRADSRSVLQEGLSETHRVTGGQQCHPGAVTITQPLGKTAENRAGPNPLLSR